LDSTHCPSRKPSVFEIASPSPGVFCARSVRRRWRGFAHLPRRNSGPTLRMKLTPTSRTGSQPGHRYSARKHVGCAVSGRDVSLLYLNPPYDFETGQTNNQRLELVFLQHTYRWLKPGGVLVFVIPQPQLRPCAKMLSEHFTDLVVLQIDRTRQRPVPASCSVGRAAQATPAHPRLRATGMRALAGDAGN